MKGTALNLKVMKKVMKSRRIQRAQKENVSKVTFLDNSVNSATILVTIQTDHIFLF